MKAMVLTEIGKIEIVERPNPAFQDPANVLLRIVGAGICGADLPKSRTWVLWRRKATGSAGEGPDATPI